MPKRMNKKLWQLKLTTVICRYQGVCGFGDLCLMCHKTKFKAGERTLDHLNNLTHDNRSENLNLLCRGCNAGEGNRIRHKNPRWLTAETLPTYLARLPKGIAPESRVPPVCERRKSSRKAKILRTGKPYTPRNWRSFGTSEETNQKLEPAYRLWVFRHIMEFGWITKADAKYGGAEFLHKTQGQGSPATTERYFGKMISSQGKLEKQRNEEGQLVFVIRPDVDILAWQAELMEQADQPWPEEPQPPKFPR